MILAAITRNGIADFVSSLIWVYTILIFAYILSQMFFGVGGRIPYNRALRAVLDFLEETCEPFLRPFRRIVPQMGMIDFSPMVATFTLIIVGRIVVALIRG